jgi:hypothetical protein
VVVLIRFIIIILIVFITSCHPDFSKPKYKNKFKKNWSHKRVPIYKQGTYKDPNIKKEVKRKLLYPKRISFDNW